MIFYFSGTGNSAWAARYISKQLGDDNLLFIPDQLNGDKTYRLSEGERLGFVFPTYGWGVPQFIEQFISAISIQGVDYLYFVTTCGDDTGMTREIFCDAVERKGWTCALGYAIQMPETYICLPGFELDSKEKESRKLSDAQVRIERIVDDIRHCRRGIFDCLPGSMPWLKSKVVRPVFNNIIISPRPFRTTDSCISCGLCQRQCPMHNITLIDHTTPSWGDHCVGCLRCYHSCPSGSIRWGIFTDKKGQYLAPMNE